MSPKRGDPVAPPPGQGEYEIRYDSNECVSGWRELGNKAPGNTHKAWMAMRTDPAPVIETERHHRLKFNLATVDYKGAVRDQWQIEVTGGGRIWYVIEEDRKIVWMLMASVGHPKKTE